MQGTAMIERTSAAPDLSSPKRSSSKHDEAFERIFNDKKQPDESPAVDRHARKKNVENKADKPDVKQQSVDKEQKTAAVEHEDATEKVARPKQETKAAAEVEEDTHVAKQQEVDPAKEALEKIQQTLVRLMKAISKQDDDADTDSRDQIDSLLTDLVQQLDSTDLNGEEVLAGIDLSALADQLDELKKSEEKDHLLAQLVSGIESQLVAPPAEAAATSVQVATAPEVTAAQGQSVGKAETLAQARQILQQAIDAVKAQDQTEPAATAGVATTRAAEDGAGNKAKTAEERDPRFAGLLNPRAEQRVAQGKPTHPTAASAPASQAADAQLQQTQKTHAEQHSATATEGLTAEQVQPKATASHVSQMTELGDKHVLDGLSHQAHHAQPGQGPVAGADAAKAMPQNPVVQLPSGQQVAESQIFDQVVSHLSGSANGESGRMVLRLQPAELGSLKLDLAIEGDKISANIHAQSQQVREVLERHLPQLRNALAEQGLKVEQFQVSVEHSGQQGQHDNLSRQQQQFGQSQQQQHSRFYQEVPEEDSIPLVHLLQNGGGGISLHV